MFFLVSIDPPTCLEYPVLLHTFPIKYWLSRPPLPFGISNDHPWDGNGYFLEKHILSPAMMYV